MLQKRFIGIKELSEYLDTPVGTLYVWICQKKIPYYKIGRNVKFDLEKIEDWLKKKEVKPHPIWEQR
jgi:excisionase family DNA binding protein